MSLLTDAWAGLKAATGAKPPPPPAPFAGNAGPTWSWHAAGPGLDWDREAGDPTSNSILTIALRWLVTNFVAAPIGVRKGLTEAEGQFVPGHALTTVLRYGNQVYDGRTLLQSAVADYLFRGTAYFLKGRNAPRTAVLEWWYEPYATIRPVWPRDGSKWIDHYDVFRDGKWQALPYTEDVIAWTWGTPDPATRRGRDPLAAFKQERALARQVNEYLATVLINQGIVGMLVSPKAQGVGIKNPQGLKDRLETLTTGENKGRVVVMGEPIDVTFPNSAPDTMPVERLDGRTEERLTAALGLNRLVAGLGNDGTFSNQDSAEKHAWTNTVLPLHADLCATLDRHLLPDFSQAADEHTAFDTSGIKALQENKLDAAKVDQIYVSAKIKTANEVRKVLGLPPHPDGDKLGSPPPPVLVAPPADANADPTAPPPNGKPGAGDVPAELVPAKPEQNGKG